MAGAHKGRPWKAKCAECSKEEMMDNVAIPTEHQSSSRSLTTHRDRSKKGDAVDDEDKREAYGQEGQGHDEACNDPCEADNSKGEGEREGEHIECSASKNGYNVLGPPSVHRKLETKQGVVCCVRHAETAKVP